MSLFISGLFNCHKVGLHSYVIRDRLDEENGMVRVFHNQGNALTGLMEGPQFSLAPHNHRQDLWLYQVQGTALNVSFSIDRQIHTRDFTEYKFESKIVDGNLAIRPISTVDLRVADIRPISEEGIFLSCREVHTVVASPNSAWLVVEKLMAPAKHASLCYGYHGLKLNSKDLYRQMTPSNLRAADWDIGDAVRYALGENKCIDAKITALGNARSA